ncbi:transcription repressor [Rhynchospora pubera]|uniref:Transcription repressor n=1 Tax=Rhynchospora pubera TaxID=906938 RepID=A0AAV8BTQ2_9POAL|nr:transcription repressor [Rhynchospora pubera]
MSNQGNGKKVRKSHSLFPLGCGCKDVKAVSVAVPKRELHDKSSYFRTNVNNVSSTDTLTHPSVSISSWQRVGEAERPESSASTPSFSGLLRELNELERTVKEWGRNKKYASSPLGSFSSSDKNKERIGSARLDESIVVVKESDDPLDDFKKSMLQMIVENEIASKDEMEELLHRFLLLNSLENHNVIIRAFTELWEEVLSEVEETPKLRSSRGEPRPFGLRPVQ